MNKKNLNYILGIMLILFGTVFVVSPKATFETIVLAGGIILIIYAIIKIITLFRSSNSYVSYSIGSTVFSLLFGLVLVFNTEGAVKIIPMLLGIWLLVSGLSSLLFVLKITKNKRNIVISIIKVMLGLISFLLPVIPVIATGIFVGIVLVTIGVTTIISNKEDDNIYKVKVKKTHK